MELASQAISNTTTGGGNTAYSGLTPIDPFEFVADITFSKAYPSITKQTEEQGTPGKWVVEGFASTTDLDSQDHTITKEAIEQGANSLQQYTTLLFNHDPNRPIGHIEKAEAQDGKLFIKAIIDPSEPIIWKKIQEGTLSKFSVFGKILDAEEGELESKSVLVIKSMELYEVSVVSVPANAAAKAIAWYVEKALMSQKGLDNGFSPMTLVPQSWANQMRKTSDGQKVAIDDGKKKPVKQSNGGNQMAKNENLEQALSLLKAALESANDEQRVQLEAQIRALEALQKGEGPIDNDPENKDRMGQVGRGRMGVNTFPTNFPPDTKKVSVGNEADLSLQGTEDGEGMGLMESLENALMALQNATPELQDEDKAIASRVVQWLEAKIADTTPSPASPGAANRTARASVNSADAFSKAIGEMKLYAEHAVTSTAEMKAIQKNVNETAQAILAVASQLTNSSLRKGQGPEADGTERDGNEVGVLDMMEKQLGTEKFSKMDPQERLRLYLNSRVVGH
jgi:HK97 family phage prohead protease